MSACSRVVWALGAVWLVGVVALIGVEMTPAIRKKTVTLTLPAGERTQVVYSALQADPEVVYDIKTVYQPLLLQDAKRLAGQVITVPYDQHLRKLAWRLTREQGPWALCGAALVGLAGGGCRRFGKSERSVR